MAEKPSRIQLEDRLIQDYPTVFDETLFLDIHDKYHNTIELPTVWLANILPQFAEKLLGLVNKDQTPAIDRIGRYVGTHDAIRFELIDTSLEEQRKTLQTWLNEQTPMICEYCGQPATTVYKDNYCAGMPRHVCQIHYDGIQRVLNYFRVKAKNAVVIKHARKVFGWNAKQCFAWRNRTQGHRVLSHNCVNDDTEARKGLLKALETLRGKLELRACPLEALNTNKQIIDQEFPWLERVTKAVFQRIEVGAILNKPIISFAPILMVGPKGIGKSRYTRRLAEVLGLPTYTIPVGGSSDNRSLVGTSKGWGSATPGDLIKFIAMHQCANPLLVLDEIDKESSSSHNGRMSDSLHLLLEPETAQRWYDECLQEACDVSRVNWIATANSTASLSDSLLSRFQVIEVELPKQIRVSGIVANIRKDLAKHYGITPAELPTIEYEEIDFLEKKLASGASLRVLKKMVEYLIAEKLRSPERCGLVH